MRQLLLVIVLLALTPASAGAVMYTVDTRTDGPAGLADGSCPTPCTLREAITEANATTGARIATVAALDQQTILPVLGALPPITASDTTLDGCPAPQATPCLGLRAASPGTAGIAVAGTGVTVRGLAITGFGRGIDLSGSSGARVQASYVGLPVAPTPPATGYAAADAIANSVGIYAGDARNATIGGVAGDGVVISGNTDGLLQSGSGALALRQSVLGFDPDASVAIPNAMHDAVLTGSATTPVSATGNVFGPADEGLRLQGAGALVTGNWFRGVGVAAAFSGAALRLSAAADDATIGGASAVALPAGCFPLAGACNVIGGPAAGRPAIAVDGADRTRILGNLIGDGFAPPVAGVPIAIGDDPATGDPAIGTTVGGDSPLTWNDLRRTAGPGITIAGGAQGATVLDNIGIAASGGALLTDLLPVAGAGNDGGANGGLQAPVLDLLSTLGAAGSARPGATVRLAQLQRPLDPQDPETGPVPPLGFLFPATPATATAGADGRWVVSFAAPLPRGQSVIAWQTTSAGSSEPSAAAVAAGTGSTPIVTITSGPPLSTLERIASISFTADKPGSRFECSLDGEPYQGCSSPLTTDVLVRGAHQLRVRAIDPFGAAGGPASRAWSIDVPATLATVRPGSSLRRVIGLPSATRCVRSGALRVRLRPAAGLQIKLATITVAGHRSATLRSRAQQVVVTLSGLPRHGRFSVVVRATMSDGRKVTLTRRYRRCAARAHPRG